MTDRNTYRLREDDELREQAKYNPTAELAIVLAERLEEVYVEFDEQFETAKEATADAEREVSRLDDKVYELQLEINKLELMLEERNRIIDELKKGN